MRAQLRCLPRTMFECIQSSRDTQPELVADLVGADLRGSIVEGLRLGAEDIRGSRSLMPRRR
jgi:hypothetical protein